MNDLLKERLTRSSIRFTRPFDDALTVTPADVSVIRQEMRDNGMSETDIDMAGVVFVRSFLN